MAEENLLGIYAIFDKKSERYDTPFIAYSDLFAKRRFMLMLDEDGPLRKWPDDFRLDKVGSFDVKTSNVKETKNMLLEAGAVIKKEEKK